MIIRRLYSKTEENKVVDNVKKSTKKKAAETVKNREPFMKVVKNKLLKDPRAKKLGYLGLGAAGGTLAVEGIDAGVKKIKGKKKEREVKEQILRGLDKK